MTTIVADADDFIIVLPKWRKADDRELWLEKVTNQTMVFYYFLRIYVNGPYRKQAVAGRYEMPATG